MPRITSGATTVGAVQISGLAPNSTPIESWLNGLLNAKGYATAAAIFGVAAQNSISEIRNPAGSGKNLWVYSVFGSTTLAGVIGYRFASPPTLAGGTHGLNLSTGLANSVAFIANGNTATPGGIVFGQTLGAAGVTQQSPLPWVIVLPPNTALLLNDGNLNDNLNLSFTWLEV